MSEDKIVTLDKIREQADVRAALGGMARVDIENAMLHMIGIGEAAAARVHALEVELDATRNHLERERRLNATIKRRQGKKGRPRLRTDAQWFELVSAFDPAHITPLPIPGRVFVLGHVDDMIIVEVPAECTDAQILGFKELLHKSGMTSAAMIVKEGTRFLKLAPCDAAQTKAIDARIREHDERAAQTQAQAEASATSEDRAEAPRAIF